MKNIIIGPLVKGIFRPWVTGAGNVPADGAVILASNHLSFVDSIFLPLVIERPMVFLAKSDYFTGKGIKGWFTKMFFLGTGHSLRTEPWGPFLVSPRGLPCCSPLPL
jgi:1-acyl-sn-glycerol-3-phosphate acyltransferase